MELKNVECRHNVPCQGYRGSVVHVIVFYDPETHETWCWKTSATTSALGFIEGRTYSFSCTDEGEHRISHVK